MSKNSNRALILYQMNYNNWDSTFREKLSKSEEHYRNWFFTQAKEVSISDEIYNEFINNPIMLSGITNTLLEESYHTFKSDVPSDYIYFVLNPEPYLRIINHTINAQYKTPAVESFAKLLEDIASEKIFVIAEYNKKKGWFDFEKVYNQRQELKKRHELEIRQLEKRLRNEE